MTHRTHSLNSKTAAFSIYLIAPPVSPSPSSVEIKLLSLDKPRGIPDTTFTRDSPQERNSLRNYFDDAAPTGAASVVKRVTASRDEHSQASAIAVVVIARAFCCYARPQQAAATPAQKVTVL
jgi:hypothetical protein